MTHFIHSLAILVFTGTLLLAPFVRPVDADEPVGFFAQVKLTAEDGASGDRFGASVAVDGDTVVVGAHHDDDVEPDSGSAYVFQRDFGGPDAWGQVTKLRSSAPDAGENFGISVSLAGDTLVVGEWNSDSAYVFQRDFGGADAWGQVAKLTDDDGETGDQFGISVAITGDTVVVGAVLDDDLGSASGSAYVFQRDFGGPDVWGQVAKLTAADGESGDTFGVSVAVASDTVVVGANQDDDLGDSSGSAYVFKRDLGGTDAWGQAAKLTAADGESNDLFGISVAIAGDTVIAGAEHDDDLGDSSGSAYVYRAIPPQYCFSFDNLCDGIEVTSVLPDKTVAATWRNWNCAGAIAPMMGGYSGKSVLPRLSWLAADPLVDLSTWSFNLNVDARTFDLWVHDTDFSLGQMLDDEPYSVAPGACAFGPEKQGLPASTGVGQ